MEVESCLLVGLVIGVTSGHFGVTLEALWDPLGVTLGIPTFYEQLSQMIRP